MDSNIPQDPLPAGPNQEQADSTPEAVSSQEHKMPDAHPVTSTYHRSVIDGSYVGVDLSPGFRFAPEDEELVKHYLNKKINNHLAKHIKINDLNVYKHDMPGELAAGKNQSFGEDEWYFFSPRDRKYTNGDLQDRKAGNGYWRETGADRTVYLNDVCIGSKKCLVFYEGKGPKANKTNWIMHEYVSNQPQQQLRDPNDNMHLDDYVLCRIYKKPDRQPKGEEEQITDDDAAKSDKTECDHQQHQNIQVQPRQIGDDDLEKELEAFYESISNDVIEPQNYPSVFYSGFEHLSTLPDLSFNDFDPYNSSDGLSGQHNCDSVDDFQLSF